MERLVIRVRRSWALGGFLAGALMLALFGVGGFLLIRARDPSGALAPWWLQLLLILLCGFNVAVGAAAVRMSLRGLTGVPRATIDHRGIDIAGVGSVEWADIRAVEIVPRRRGPPRLRLTLDRWERYASRQPSWLRRLERWLPRHEAVALDLIGTDADPTALSASIRAEAARHRRAAAELP